MADAVASYQLLSAPIPNFPENLAVRRPPDLVCRTQVCDEHDLYSQATDPQSRGKIRFGTIDVAVNDVVVVVVEQQDLEATAAVIAADVDVRASGSTSLSWLETPTQPSDIGARISTGSRAIIFVGNSTRFSSCAKVVCPTVEADEANFENR